ncbi:MAG: dockerin type I domain-containing protein [Terriglobia bacterium]
MKFVLAKVAARVGTALGLLFISATFSSILAQNVTLSWNPNTESNLAGYKIYFGTSSANLSSSINVGNVTTYTVTGLTFGTTYYFAATAYNASGSESGFSNMVYTTIGSSSPSCDVNGDGAVNALDMQGLSNAILAGSTSAVYDINRDTVVNALDLQRLANIILGITVCQ